MPTNRRTFLKWIAAVGLGGAFVPRSLGRTLSSVESRQLADRLLEGATPRTSDVCAADYCSVTYCAQDYDDSCPAGYCAQAYCAADYSGDGSE